MSLNTDMLAKAVAAYEAALAHQSASIGDKRHDNHAIDKLRAEMLFWERRVADEQARAAGTAVRKPFQVLI